MRIKSIRVFNLVLLALTLGFFLSTAGAQSGKDFFKGKPLQSSLAPPRAGELTAWRDFWPLTSASTFRETPK